METIKKILKSVFLFVFVYTMFFTWFVYASDDVSIYINGDYLECPVKAYIENGRTMVPARSIFERLGATVSWDAENRTVTAEKDGKRVKLIIGSRALNTEGTLSTMDTAPLIKENITFVPARAVSQSLSANVTWIPSLRAVNITTGNIMTLSDYPAAVITEFIGINAVCITESPSQMNFLLTVPEDETSEIASEIINFVVNYEKTMSDIGWIKRIPENSKTIFAAEFYGNTKSECLYKVKYFMDKIGQGQYNFYVIAEPLIKVYNVRNGTVENITESDYLDNTKYRDTETWKKSLNKTVTLYGNNNNTVDVLDYEVYRYLLNGFTEYEKTVKMYSPEGKGVSIPVNLAEQYKTFGYTMSETILMYSPDGKTEYTDSSLLSVKISQGWSTEPFKIILYSHLGESVTINRHQADKYLSEGWYKEAPVALYHSDGRKIYVPKEEVPFYCLQGWTAEPVKHTVENTDTDYVTEYTDVYITPTGKKFHISQKCAGSGAILKKYHEIKGLYEPCKNCSDYK